MKRGKGGSSADSSTCTTSLHFRRGAKLFVRYTLKVEASTVFLKILTDVSQFFKKFFPNKQTNKQKKKKKKTFKSIWLNCCFVAVVKKIVRSVSFVLYLFRKFRCAENRLYREFRASGFSSKIRRSSFLSKNENSESRRGAIRQSKGKSPEGAIFNGSVHSIDALEMGWLRRTKAPCRRSIRDPAGSSLNALLSRRDTFGEKNVLIDIVQVARGLRLRERRSSTSDRNVTLIGSDVSECLSFFAVSRQYLSLNLGEHVCPLSLRKRKRENNWWTIK